MARTLRCTASKRPSAEMAPNGEAFAIESRRDRHGSHSARPGTDVPAGCGRRNRRLKSGYSSGFSMGYVIIYSVYGSDDGHPRRGLVLGKAICRIICTAGAVTYNNDGGKKSEPSRRLPSKVRSANTALSAIRPIPCLKVWRRMGRAYLLPIVLRVRRNSRGQLHDGIAE